MCIEAEVLAGFRRPKQLLHRPLGLRRNIAGQFRRSETVKLSIVSGMCCHQVALQVRRKLGDFQARGRCDAEDFLAVSLALGGELQIKEPLVPGGNLDADIAHSCCPSGHPFERVVRRLIAGKLRQKNSRSFDGLHCWFSSATPVS